MSTPIVGLPQIKAWLDMLEVSLQSEAKAYGLIGHASSVGTVREFLVSRVLRSIVPPAVHFSSGRILNSDQSLSGQMDILLIDPRFPVFESPASIGIYLTESVISAIEVKSQLTTTSFAQALRSLAAACRPHIKVRVEDLEAAVQREAQRTGDVELARVAVAQAMSIRTFLFALSSDMTPHAAARTLLDHVRSFETFDPGDVRLPRVIVAGEIVGVIFDGNARLANAVFSDDSGTVIDEVIPIAGFWRTRHRFGTFAANVALAAIDRLGAINAMTGVRYAPEAYFPIGLYSEETAQDEACFAVLKRGSGGEWEPALAPRPMQR